MTLRGELWFAVVPEPPAPQVFVVVAEGVDDFVGRRGIGLEWLVD
jgi:hypothetical protein